MPINELLNLYHFRVIKVHEKYLEGTYRAASLKSWGIKMVKK
jgi:hypothetical protein